MRTTGLGFAGVGWLGESLIANLPAATGLQLVGVQDVRLELAQDVAARHGARWCGEHFADLLQQPEIDAVVICTPNALHAPQAMQALQAGKHVLVQKPLALSLPDARAVVDLAHNSGKLLFVDYTYRFLDTMAAMRAALTRIGRPTAMQAEFHNIYGPGTEKAWFFDRRLSGGGALLDLGVHLLDLAVWLLAPAAVTLELADLERSGIERAAALRVRFGDDLPFDLAVSWNAPLQATRIGFEVIGSRGKARWENVDGSFFRFRTLLGDRVLLDRETTLRGDTLVAYARALEVSLAPSIDTRVYGLLDQAYAAT